MFSPCILLIDDNVKLLARLEADLRRAGYRVLTAHDGRQGAHLAQAALPQVIACNAKMQSLNGSDIRGTLARDSRTASIPFIFFTKSLDQQELVEQVNAVIRSHAVH